MFKFENFLKCQPKGIQRNTITNALHLFFLFALVFSTLFACQRAIIPALAERQNFHSSNTWKELDSYPQKQGRTDDLSFVTPQLGWVVNSQGRLYKTEDGGENWKLQFKKNDSFFRCIVFKDSLNGWFGTLGTDDEYLHSLDSIVLYETHDGGENWLPTEIKGEYPKGLCGMQKINENTLVACGRVRGPSYFLKTTDGGKTWISKNMNHLAGSLIAPHFFDEMNGILVGGTTRDKENCRSLILSTKDGGENWDTIFISSQKGEYLWKVSFPSEKIGFISVQRNNRKGRTTFLQSIDGGRNWEEKIYTKGHYYAQGIGFANDSLGWIGGSFQHSYETRDGGKTWHPISTGLGINKFQFMNETTAYMVGRGVYKLESLEPFKNGWEINYFNDGTIRKKEFYKNGKLNGPSFSYFKNRKVSVQGNYINNLQNGVWKYFYKNGELRNKIKYKNGLAQISKKYFKEYEGIYKFSETENILVFAKKRQLYFASTKTGKIRKIHPESNFKFFYDDNFDVKVSFVKNDIGQVSHFILYRPGREWKAEKLEGLENVELFNKEKDKWRKNK